MKTQLNLVKEFHKKFNVPILEDPALIPKDRSRLRHLLMKEEVEEYIEGVGKEDLPNIAKELADVIYSALGTVIEHGLQDQFEAIFMEVHQSNMSKSYSEYKMLKGPEYFKANIKQFL